MPFRHLRKVIAKGYNERSLAAASALFEKYIWGTANIKDKAVLTDKLGDKSVTTAKLDDGAVTTVKIPDEAITSAKLLPGQYGGAYVKLVDSKATTVSGGASIVGIQTRDLNLEVTDTGNHCDIAYTLAYDAQTVNFTVGQVVTDGTSGATGTIVADEDAGATGTLWIINITGTFGDNNIITDPLGGSSTANIPSGVAGKGSHLDAGTWYIRASAPAVFIQKHKIILYNISDTSNEIVGQTAYSGILADGTQSNATLNGEFIISVSKTLKINHYTQVVRAINGLGIATSDGTEEIYTVVELWKVKEP